MAERWPALFVTGTDTGVGKTLVSTALLLALRSRGLSPLGLKPIASGARRTADGLRNGDALALRRASGRQIDYARVNPFCFQPPIAPHIAAEQAGVRVDFAGLDRARRRLARCGGPMVIEGAGGWLTPINRRQTLGDWVAARDIPVLLVVGVRLGCLNHAQLSAQAIGARLVGWVASVLPPELREWRENVEDLQRRLPAPLLGIAPCGCNAQALARTLDLPPDFTRPTPDI